MEDGDERAVVCLVLVRGRRGESAFVSRAQPVSVGVANWVTGQVKLRVSRGSSFLAGLAEHKNPSTMNGPSGRRDRQKRSRQARTSVEFHLGVTLLFLHKRDMALCWRFQHRLSP